MAPVITTWHVLFEFGPTGLGILKRFPSRRPASARGLRLYWNTLHDAFRHAHGIQILRCLAFPFNVTVDGNTSVAMRRACFRQYSSSTLTFSFNMAPIGLINSRARSTISSSTVVRFEPRTSYFGKPLVNEPQLDFSSTYAYAPRAGSLYLQDKMDIPRGGDSPDFGVRFDFLDPRAARPAIEATLQG